MSKSLKALFKMFWIVRVAGDVRAGSVKRIASAVGEGSISVQFVHRVLRELANTGNAAADAGAMRGCTA